MLQDIKYRWLIIGFAIIAAAYLVWPTYKFYSLNESEKKQFDINALKELKGDAINLGLDLQGGMYVLLEVNVPVLVEKIATKTPIELSDLISLAENASFNNQSDFFDEFLNLSIEKEIDLFRYYTNLASQRDNLSVIQELKVQRDNAMSSSLEIIRNRIDEFGVSEPTIQKYGANRIIVELAGITDPNRARNLIQRTASLEFALVLNNKWELVLDKLDSFLLADMSMVDSLYDSFEFLESKEHVTRDSEDIFFEENIVNQYGQDNSTAKEVLKEKPFSGYLRGVLGGIGVISSEYEIVKKILNTSKVKAIIPREGKFLWGSKFEVAQDETGEFIEYRQLYYVASNPEITGGMVREPVARMGSAGSESSGQWIVNMSMNPEGTKRWSRFTGANINRQVAIVLDDKVYMAPFIRDKIPTGQTQVTGFSDVNEAKDIANVLRAGELPAPVEIVEERTIGPSLGSDSIDSGRKAMLLGLLMIIIFIIIYYKGSGLLATFALLLNLFFIVAILAGLNATLTLPGIAGLILTIGMSIDANVIIFERIREELDVGKTVRAAINSAYERAFITILDANVTTLIAAFVLAYIGSGPIKGFAVTLSSGILCSMFTAIFVTRTIFMLFTSGKTRQDLSI
ncbi:MAG: protein translocase subunit SecD [Candidatus Neomarinimicrobiota bacterium]|nr:protein translocase subunit SecD [Candidatus Neomarinimicrobiota bacterium]